MLLAATKDLHYQLNLASIATLWMGGCIIRSRLLTLIHGCYVRRRDVNLFEDAEYAGRIKTHLGGWRRCLQWAVGRGVPVPGMASALTFLDGYTSAILPGASLIQAQRDYFGAHTFEWMQQPGEFVHYDWQQHQ
jgi:6-phosphogluconate dehydrogenase